MARRNRAAWWTVYATDPATGTQSIYDELYGPKAEAQAAMRVAAREHFVNVEARNDAGTVLTAA